jgi:restriction endonuclease S subunit
MKAHHGRFSVNYDRGILIPKTNKINVEYVQYVLEPTLRNIAVGRRDISGKDEFTKLYLSTIQEQVVYVPLDKNNEISEDLQLEIINEYQFIKDLKNELNKYLSLLKHITMKISYSETEYTFEPITKYFDLIKGNNVYTNNYVKKNPGIYPLYSSQTTNYGILGKINRYDIDSECITWTTDGIYAGTVFLRDGKFSMTTHCGALLLKEEYKKSINISYIYHYLKNNLMRIAVGEQNKRVTINLIKNLFIPIPYELGEINYKWQLLIDEKYSKLENIKYKIINEISRIIEIDPVIIRENSIKVQDFA